MNSRVKVGGSPKVYKYRWVVLVAFMLLNVVVQIQWLAHAGIARPATVFFEAHGAVFNNYFNVDQLAMLYMLVFLVACFPASFVIDKFGIRAGIGFGSALAGVAALVKGIFAANFLIVFIAQVGLAFAQPFIINAYTALGVKWFPMKERGTAVGLASLSQYLGIIIAFAVTPMFVNHRGEGIEGIMLFYGILTTAVCFASILIIKEEPPTPVSSEKLEKLNFFAGLKNMFKKKDMIIVILMFFIGLGIFNAVSTLTDALNNYLGVEDSNGLIGTLMIIGGIIGAIVIPILSDAMRKRKLFLIICIIGMAVGTTGLTLSKYVNNYSYQWKLLSAPEGSQFQSDSETDISSIFNNNRQGIQRIQPDEAGIYQFSLKVSKKGEQVESKTVTLYVAEESPKVLKLKNGTILTPLPLQEDKRVQGKGYFAFSKITRGEPNDEGVVKLYAAKTFLENSSIDNKVSFIVYLFALISAFVLGFFVMSAGPIGFQYAAEVTFPTPEASSQGMLLLAGQITGLIFTQLMSINSNQYLPLFMILFSIIATLCIFLTIVVQESPMIITEQDKALGNMPKGE